jgi:hypothetical protein
VSKTVPQLLSHTDEFINHKWTYHLTLFGLCY